MKYTGGSNGFELLKVADKYQFRTRAIFAPYIRELKAERPRRLSAAALETLAVVAYRQPVVKSDIERIRGVDVTPTLKTLLERALVKIVGHQPTAGQPALYGTTEEFLRLFSLNSLAQLPSLRDLREFERDPGESEEQSAPEPQSPQQESVAASPE
jgi:segregation and condensation protein B